MSRYEEGLQIIEEICGNGKDNVISLSTIAIMAIPVLMSVMWTLIMKMAYFMLQLMRNLRKCNRSL